MWGKRNCLRFEVLLAGFKQNIKIVSPKLYQLNIVSPFQLTRETVSPVTRIVFVRTFGVRYTVDPVCGELIVNASGRDEVLPLQTRHVLGIVLEDCKRGAVIAHY